MAGLERKICPGKIQKSRLNGDRSLKEKNKIIFQKKTNKPRLLCFSFFLKFWSPVSIRSPAALGGFPPKMGVCGQRRLGGIQQGRPTISRHGAGRRRTDGRCGRRRSSGCFFRGRRRRRMELMKPLRPPEDPDHRDRITARTVPLLEELRHERGAK